MTHHALSLNAHRDSPAALLLGGFTGEFIRTKRVSKPPVTLFGCDSFGHVRPHEKDEDDLGHSERALSGHNIEGLGIVGGKGIGE